jgi:hypothetical protein
LSCELEKLRHNYGLANLFGAALNSREPVEILDFHLCILPSGKLIPQDPQAVLFHATLGSGSEVIAKTFDGGHRRTVGLAVITRRHGHLQVIYIGSGFEAVYEETLDERFRTYCHSLLDPILMPTRTDEVEFRPGLMSKFDSSEDTTVVHLIVIIPATSGRSVWCRSPFCRSRMCEWASGSPRATLRSPQPCCGARRLPPERFEMAGSS